MPGYKSSQVALEDFQVVKKVGLWPTANKKEKPANSASELGIAFSGPG